MSSQNSLSNESFDLDELQNELKAQLEENLSDLEGLEEDFKKIGSPEALEDTIQSVIWEQFINQIGVVAGEDFIKENRGLTLDLRKSAHIQTAENFEKGKIATHNYKSTDQLQQNYDRYKNTPHGVFRDKYVDPGMNNTLKRAGVLKSEGIDTVKDLYTGRQIPTQTKLEDGSNNPFAAQREHVKPSAELYKNSSLQMAYDDKELADIINSPDNLQGYTTASRNNRKSDNSPDGMADYDKTKHWEKANEKADKYIKEKEKQGEKRLKQEGYQTLKEETLRIGGTALKAALMGLLAELVKEIIQKLIQWLYAGKKNLSSFFDSLKKAITNFISNLKDKLFTAGDTFLTSIVTAIFGPIIGTIKKVWIFLKQGYKSLKQAIAYIKNPENKNKPMSILMLEVGKIVIAGLTAGGAIVLGQVIEKGLMTIPGFAFPIPLLGSLASILGIFFGAISSGIIGAIAMNLIDKLIAEKQKRHNIGQQLEKKNEVLTIQNQQIVVSQGQLNQTKDNFGNNVVERHTMLREEMNNLKKVFEEKPQKPKIDNSSDLDDLFNKLNDL